MSDSPELRSVRTGPPNQDVPAELRGREVSVRALGPAWQAVRARKLDPEQIADGTGYALEHLRNPKERISWAAFATFMSNLGTHLDDDELVALGDSAMQSPALRLLLLPGRLLFSVPDLYLWAFGPQGPASQVFANHDGLMQEVERGRLRFEARMKHGYAPSRENYLLLRGSLQGLSRVAGAGPAEVAQVPMEDGALYHITVPQTGGALRSLRRRLNWLLAARSTATALRQANEELLERYVELQRESDARAEASDRLAGIVEASVDGIVGTDIDGVVTDWNPAAERIYGFTQDEIRGRRLTEVIPPDRSSESAELVERLKRGERIARFDTERLRKDGTRIQVSLGLAPVRDREGSIVGFSTLIRDETEAIEAERRRDELETKLLQAQRLESVGRLAGGIAHDFNNILTAILGFARLTAETLPAGDPNRDNVNSIESAATSAAKLVRQLLAFSRQQLLRPEILDLGELVSRVVPMFRRLIGEDIDISVQIAPGLWAVEGDPGQLEQILVNLAVNARDAMPGGGRLTIEVANADLDGSYAREQSR
jgi:PAS domain S-box-containing protein